MPYRLENSGAGFACDPVGPERGLRKGPGTQSRRGSRCVTRLRRSAIHLGFAMRRKSLLASNPSHLGARQMPQPGFIRTESLPARRRRACCPAAGRGRRQPILAGGSSPAGELPGLFNGGGLDQPRAVRAARAAAIRPDELSARPAEPSARPAEPSAGRSCLRRNWGSGLHGRATAVAWWIAATWRSANRAIRAANLDGMPRERAGRKVVQQLMTGAVFPEQTQPPRSARGADDRQSEAALSGPGPIAAVVAGRAARGKRECCAFN